MIQCISSLEQSTNFVQFISLLVNIPCVVCGIVGLTTAVSLATIKVYKHLLMFGLSDTNVWILDSILFVSPKPNLYKHL